MTNCPDGFWCMQFKDSLNVVILIFTVIAIIAGPIAAVIVTRRNDVAREKLRRRQDIFNRLMMTRRATLSADHVTALNVIQTEFHDDEKIIASFKKYMDLLAQPFPVADPSVFCHFTEEKDDAFNELMFCVGQHLGFDLDKRDLAKYSYVPQGWVNVEAEQTAIRQLTIEVLQGKRGIPVTPLRVSDVSGKFPPAPT